MDYTALKTGTVIPLIRKRGKAVSLRRATNTTGWTKTWNAGQGRYQWEEIAVPGHIVYVDPATVPADTSGYAIEKKYTQKEINNTTVFATDRRFIVSDLPNPTTSDKLVVGTTIMNIITVLPTSPGDVVLVWELQCRT